MPDWKFVGHDHQRPTVVAANGNTDNLTLANDQIVTPLVYSTELTRLIRLSVVSLIVTTKPDGTKATLEGEAMKKSVVHFEETKPGALRPSKRSRTLGHIYVVAGQIHGLVNVRTDGAMILCATMNEGDASWQVKKFPARI